jgi:hypothetical protein
MNRKTMEPKLKVYGLYTDSKIHDLLFCHSVMPLYKIQNIMTELYKWQVLAFWV